MRGIRILEGSTVIIIMMTVIIWGVFGTVFRFDFSDLKNITYNKILVL